MSLANATQLIISAVGIWVPDHETAQPKQNIYYTVTHLTLITYPAISSCLQHLNLMGPTFWFWTSENLSKEK